MILQVIGAQAGKNGMNVDPRMIFQPVCMCRPERVFR